jgi:hypothetical protein
MKIEASDSHREIRSSNASLFLMHADDKGQRSHKHRSISEAASSAIRAIPVWRTRSQAYFQAAMSTEVDSGHLVYQ